MAGREIFIPLREVCENPFLPPIVQTDIRHRPSTKDWLDKVVKRIEEERAWSDELQRSLMLAMVAPECVLRENFENYIARIGWQDALDMASIQLNITIETARRKQKKRLLRLAKNTENI